MRVSCMVPSVRDGIATSYHSPVPRSSSRPASVSATIDPPGSMVLWISLRLARSRKHCAGLIAPSMPFAHTRGEFGRLSERSRADARLCRASEILSTRTADRSPLTARATSAARVLGSSASPNLALLPNPVYHGGDPMRPGSQILFQVAKRRKHHALIATKIADHRWRRIVEKGPGLRRALQQSTYTSAYQPNL